MNAKRDVITEIEEIRGRTGPADWDNGITKLLFLCTQVKQLTDETHEQSYYPVACVAGLEVYFRWEIRNLIDSGDDRFIRNVRADDLPFRIDHELLIAVHGQRATIGELIAHAIRFNSLEIVNKTVSQLLQTDFLDLVKNARDPEERRAHGENSPPLILSISDLLAKVKRTFYLRNIICHEAHLRTTVTLAETKELCSACYQFARTSRYAIAYYENPNAPLTLEEAYQAAIGRVGVLETQIKELEDLIVLGIGDSQMVKAFRKMQEGWRLFVERQAEYDASHYINGNRGMLHEQLTIEDLYKRRLTEMKKYAAN